ncbi:putative bifunctional diguanylate cyclase/phosphodiesterase [Gluconacetobacter tumulicola]|nr:EAL domain-containing protein [Gluconacetobacter tumulicola]
MTMLENGTVAAQTMRDIAAVVPILPETAVGGDVQQHFENDPHLLYVVIVDREGHPLGLVDRHTFHVRMAGQYGYSVYHRRPVTLLMDPRPTIVEAAVLVADFLPQALGANPSELLLGFIVVEHGICLGVGSAIDLVRHAHAAKKTALSELRTATERLHEANEKILRDKLFIDRIVQNVPSPLIVRSVADGEVILMNRAARRFGDSALSERTSHMTSRMTDAAPADDGQASMEFSLEDPEGKRRDLILNRLMIADRSGMPLWDLYVFDDVTVYRENERQIERLAHFDKVTDLANRRLFSMRLEALCGGNRPAVLFYIDLDYFKTVNDVHGHPAGDALLRLVAERLREHGRPGDLIARLGGDEFAILWSNTALPSEIELRMTPLLASLSAPYLVDGKRIVIGASIGSARFPEDADSAETLLQHADMAMYRAKTQGRNRFQQFQAALSDEVRSAAILTEELRDALASETLTLHFQPIYEREGLQVRSCEALVRWCHPARGTVLPDQFIALAEQNGLIHTLGQWVMHAACREAMSWPDAIRVAVNVSSIQLGDAAFPDMVRRILRQTGLPAHRLEIEITETSFLKNEKANHAALCKLAEIGCRLVLDDFGTGYSSLKYLWSFPFSKIKIDCGFVQAMSQEKVGRIARTILSLAHSLDLSVTAEGVETDEQHRLLVRMGCDEVQGYLFARPRPVEDILPSLRACA